MVNIRTSNWYSKLTGEFQFENIKPLVGNFLPNLLGLIFLSLGMRYATMGGVNQGIIPTLLSLGGFYSSVLFYFKFNELISVAQVIGIYGHVRVKIFVCDGVLDDHIGEALIARVNPVGFICLGTVRAKHIRVHLCGFGTAAIILRFHRAKNQ